jgi:hypothetical protein
MTEEARVTAFTKTFFEPEELLGGIGGMEALDQFLALADFSDDDTNYTGESSIMSPSDGTYNI